MTGTDTGIGKTVVAAAILRALVASGERAVGMKPVAAGIAPGREVNADVDALLRAGNVDAPLADRNPFGFASAIAPHIAAAERGIRIVPATITAAYARLAARSDVVVVEGAGGVCAPIDAQRDMLDVAVALGVPVLLVVGMRLGCLNHALLSATAIEARGLKLLGWVANCLEPDMPALRANIVDLSERLNAPLIAEMAHAPSPAFPPGALPKLRG